ncbi:MAG: hypothetical protein L0Y72_15490 [Gemmataceae bacterium]|nr:hypothetical protein [Gemmataceae bacterium]MCI0740449.1 hypothetical protein [Gemmataceae bacterium]
MHEPLKLEDIEEMRRHEGIDDAELRVEIGRLKVGDFVKLTVLTGATSFETLLVRITSIRGSAFRGKLLADQQTSKGFGKLRDRPAFAFTTAHIHSIPKKTIKPTPAVPAPG